jgi:hypothetical protein
VGTKATRPGRLYPRGVLSFPRVILWLAAQPLLGRPRRGRARLPARPATRLGERGRGRAGDHLAVAAQSLPAARAGHARAQPRGRPAARRRGQPSAQRAAGHPELGLGVYGPQPRWTARSGAVGWGAGRASAPRRGLRGPGGPGGGGGGGGAAHRKPRGQAQHPSLGDHSPSSARPPPPGRPPARAALPTCSLPSRSLAPCRPRPRCPQYPRCVLGPSWPERARAGTRVCPSFLGRTSQIALGTSGRLRPGADDQARSGRRRRTRSTGSRRPGQRRRPGRGPAGQEGAPAGRGSRPRGWTRQ